MIRRLQVISSSWEDKTKYSLFSKTKRWAKVSYIMRTSLYLAVMEYLEYLGFHLNSNLRGESMAMRIFLKK